MRPERPNAAKNRRRSVGTEDGSEVTRSRGISEIPGVIKNSNAFGAVTTTW